MHHDAHLLPHLTSLLHTIRKTIRTCVHAVDRGWLFRRERERERERGGEGKGERERVRKGGREREKAYIVDEERQVSSCFIWPSSANPLLSYIVHGQKWDSFHFRQEQLVLLQYYHFLITSPMVSSSPYRISRIHWQSLTHALYKLTRLSFNSGTSSKLRCRLPPAFTGNPSLHQNRHIILHNVHDQGFI